MKRAAIEIAILALILLALCAALRVSMRSAYMAYIPAPRDGAGDDIRLVAGTPDVVVSGESQRVGEYLRIPIRPKKPGRTAVYARVEGRIRYVGDLRVGRFGTIYDGSTGGFTGDTVVMAAFTVFCLMSAVIMLRAYSRAKGPAFYSYATIYAAGLSLFAFLTGLLMLGISLRHARHPYEYTMLNAYREITSASYTFMMATAPFILVFAAGMAVSNAALVRHEGFSLKNVLGAGVGLALIAGEVLAYRFNRLDIPGTAAKVNVSETLQNVYATAFAYFECMLFGAILCGMKAARHVPRGKADYILILGCRFRQDGTLPPLLKGRMDRALSFWRAQRQTSGTEAVLVPSGGQGADEPMPEAEAMRRYLLSQGVPEGRVLPEAKSRNTLENMAFSKSLIEQRTRDARVIYATTNYHVFRSGICANQAGLPAEGIGSRTKWWYWPNAAMRECAGLFLNHLPQELLLLLIWLVFFGALSMALS